MFVTRCHGLRRVSRELKCVRAGLYTRASPKVHVVVTHVPPARNRLRGDTVDVEDTLNVADLVHDRAELLRVRNLDGEPDVGNPIVADMR